MLSCGHSRGKWGVPVYITYDKTNANDTVTTFLDLPNKVVVKVSLCHPYYLKDDSYAPESTLMLPKSIHIFTSLLKELDYLASNTATNTNTDWMLDICLDYLYTSTHFSLI